MSTVRVTDENFTSSHPVVTWEADGQNTLSGQGDRAQKVPRGLGEGRGNYHEALAYVPIGHRGPWAVTVGN